MSKRVLGVVGARPNFMKMDPVLRALNRAPDVFSTWLVHTGQHYDAAMSKVFFEELGMRSPDVDLGVGSGSHAEQTGTVMIRLEPVLREHRPEIVLVVGDVNSTLAAAITAAKMGIAVAHVEAGLRSFDRSMPEELNRMLTDAISDVLLTPSADADENLAREGIPSGRIHRVGNVMIDTLLRCRGRAASSTVLDRLALRGTRFGLVTLHRPSNVDDPATLDHVVEILEKASQRLPLVFPAHPRTVDRLNRAGAAARLGAAGRVRLVEPLGYIDFLALEGAATVVLTDSGGIQEETTVLGVPCLTLRESTERPVTVTEGTNEIVGLDAARILAALDAILGGGGKRGGIPDLWDGHAADRIAAVLRRLWQTGANMAGRSPPPRPPRGGRRGLGSG